MYNTMLMNCGKGLEHGPKVYPDIMYVHTTVKHLDTLAHEMENDLKTIYSEVLVSEMRQYSDDLILMSESGDQRANSLASSQVVKKFKFILYPHWATCDVDLLNGNIDRPTRRLLALTVDKGSGRLRIVLFPPFERRRRPFRSIIEFYIPVVLIIFVMEVFGFVNCREST